MSLWEAVLPKEVLRLPEELAQVDALLDERVFFTPFTPFTPYFNPRCCAARGRLAKTH